MLRRRSLHLDRSAPKQVHISKGDMIYVNGYELDGDILAEIIAPKAKKRLLWAFIKSADGTKIQPVCYSEEKVIWLSEEDQIRKAGDE